MMDKAGMQGFGGVAIVVHDKNSNALAERETRPRRRWRSDRSVRYSHGREFDHELAAFPHAIAPGKLPDTVLANQASHDDEAQAKSVPRSVQALRPLHIIVEDRIQHFR